MSAPSLVVMLSVTLPALAPPGRPAADDEIQYLHVQLPSEEMWSLDCYPDGRARLLYGANGQDSDTLPVGTLRFDALLTAVLRLRTEVGKRPFIAATISRKGAGRDSHFLLSDDALFRYLLAAYEGKWERRGEAVRPLWKEYPIFPDDSKGRPAPPAGRPTKLVLRTATGWVLEFSGSIGVARLQYGDRPGEAATLPRGSVYSAALRDAVYRLATDKKVEGGTTAEVVREGQPRSEPVPLRDDTLFRYLVAAFDDTWKPEGDGFRDRLKTTPVFPADKGR